MRVNVTSIVKTGDRVIHDTRGRRITIKPEQTVRDVDLSDKLVSRMEMYPGRLRVKRVEEEPAKTAEQSVVEEQGQEQSASYGQHRRGRSGRSSSQEE